MSKDIHQIDNTLIAWGKGLLVVSLLAAGCAATGTGTGPGWLWVFGLAAALVTLSVGLAIRRREDRVIEIWNVLERAGEAHVDEVARGLGYDRVLVLGALPVINRQPDAYYVWDEDSDTIVDGRLRVRYRLVEQCPSCGARVDLRVPLDLSEPAACPYCEAGVSAADLNRMKAAGLAGLDGGGAPARPFSLLVFVVLLFVFWPAAVVYAVWKTGFFRRVPRLVD